MRNRLVFTIGVEFVAAEEEVQGLGLGELEAVADHLLELLEAEVIWDQEPKEK